VELSHDCSNSTTQEPHAQAEPRRYLIGSTGDPYHFLKTCPHATTLEADGETRYSAMLIALTCKRWGCPYCGRRRALTLAMKCEAAAATKFITITCWTKLYENPRHAFDCTRRKISDLSKLIKKKYGEWEYLRVLEATAAGWPHYHFVARCKYISRIWLSQTWEKLTGSPRVDVQEVDGKKGAFQYVLKYLSKQAYVPWTNRRVSWSKNFFPPKDPAAFTPIKLWGKERLLIHPAERLLDRYQGWTVEQITPTMWAVRHPEEQKYVEADRRARRIAESNQNLPSQPR
jgi:hypothetical protein